MAENEPRKLFGARLLTLRRRLGWTQERLAAESGMDRDYVDDIERGNRNITINNICKLAKTIAIPPHELMKFGE